MKTFFHSWGMRHLTGIPDSSTGQAVVGHTHALLKKMLLKQKRGDNLGITPQEQLDQATFVLNFLSISNK